MLAENTNGNYTFARGIGPFSAAVTAHPGFESFTRGSSRSAR